MHRSSMLRMQWFRENFFKDIVYNNKNDVGASSVTVLDLGSQCVVGQSDTYRIFFDDEPFRYIGLDMIAAHNVDIVVKNPYCWKEVPDNFADVLISGQVFEHIEFPWLTIAEIARVVKPGGLICIIVPSMAGLHRYPVHCQNYFSDGMIALAKYAGLEVIHASTQCAPLNAPLDWYDRAAHDTLLVAKKSSNWIAKEFDAENYVCEPADLQNLSTGLIRKAEQPWFVRVIRYRLSRWWKSIKKRFLPRRWRQ